MESQFNFVQVNEFQANVDGWQLIGNVSWKQTDDRTILLTNEDFRSVQISFLSASSIRVRFNPQEKPDYSNNNSYAVVNRNLGPVNIQIQELPDNGGTLLVNTGVLQVYIGLTPYGIAVYKNGQLITEDTYGKNLIYSNEAVANLKNAPVNESYYGFGEKAGSQLNKRQFTMTFFNYDNFTYNDVGAYGNMVVPDGNQGGPLNPSGPLYNSLPFMLAIATQNSGQSAVQYSYGIFLDNVSQTFFNMGSNDYSDMNGKYYFGALYGDLDYYILVGNEQNNPSRNPIPDVLNQYNILTGQAHMPPMYALGYQQGCYGYYDKNILLQVAQDFRNNNIPIDGLHIDVDFQNNYRTFTISSLKFPDAKGMFDTLHQMGYRCSTNITGIISANPLDENGSTDTPYPTRDNLLYLNPNNAATSVYKDNAPVRPFLYNTRYGAGENPLLFFANESYGVNYGLNPYKYPTPLYPDGTDQLGTYGYYCDMGRADVQQWWGQQYDYLLQQGLDMIWQDMTDPAVVPNADNDNPDKTLPLDLMMYDKVTGQYVPQAKIHNAFAINLIDATFRGLNTLKSSQEYSKLYNYKKRNFIIARGGYSGVHRYAGIWTGDSASSWDFLAINIPEVLNIGLSGQPMSGCDIGGFANGSASSAVNGVTDPELFTRWMNVGAFLPWYRNHYDGYTKAFQEPYKYGDPVLSNCRRYIEMRYRLLQVFYDAVYENTVNGMPVSRALFLNESADPEIFNNLNDQFFVGKDLLVAPVVTQNTWNRNVYLPAGSNWYVFDDQLGQLTPPTTGGYYYNWYVPLGLVPVYVREGAILPIRQLEQYVGQLSVNPLTFAVYPGKDSNYTLYQDDRFTTENVDSGAYRVTEISTSTVNGIRNLILNRVYDKYTPAESYFYVAFMGYGNPPAAVQCQNQDLQQVNSQSELTASSVNAYWYDSENQKVNLKISDNNSVITISIR
jgi:alpha-glucosidase